MSQTKATGTFTDPNSPVYSLSFDPKGGSGILKAIIWVTFEGHDVPLERLLAYSFVETVNGLEIDIERPEMPRATALEEDINLSLSEEFKGKRFTINFITK